jgi:predicted RNA-binding protein with PIN domain
MASALSRKMDVIIDGYNLIGAEQGLSGSLEHKRNRLIQQIADYQRRKPFNFIVVFDGWRAGRDQEAQERHDGIMIVYSRLGEKADGVIVRMAREKGSGSVVITSDREIRRAVERFGAVAVYAGEFNQILRALDGVPAEDYVDESEMDSSDYDHRNRLSKSDRKRREKLQKLRL